MLYKISGNNYLFVIKACHAQLLDAREVDEIVNDLSEMLIDKAMFITALHNK